MGCGGEGGVGADVSTANMIYESRCFLENEAAGCVSTTVPLTAAPSTPTFVCVTVPMTMALVRVCVRACACKQNGGFDHSDFISVSHELTGTHLTSAEEFRQTCLLL